MSTTTVPFTPPLSPGHASSQTDSAIQWPDLTPEEVGTLFPQVLASERLATSTWLRNHAENRGDGFNAGPQNVGDRLVLLGGAPTDLVSSYFAHFRHKVSLESPGLDPASEKRLRGVVKTLMTAGVAASVHDLVAGGLMVTIAQKLLASSQAIGAKLDLHSFGTARTDLLLFGEGAARAVLTVRAEKVGTVLSEAHTNGVAATVVGEITAEPVFSVSTRRLLGQWAIEDLRIAIAR
ncbi:MAG: hypothetical protein SFV32_07390 [Opitutaceae bacterium]|nr:hypothetical protein [Opitutaceae bacterium]